MQSEDMEGRIVQAVPVDLSQPQELVKAIEAAKAKGAVQHIIAELPVWGEILRIKGLKYEVVDTDQEKGQITVQLCGPEDQHDSHDERRHGKRRMG